MKIAALIMTALFFCPVFTRVSVETRVRVIDEDGDPFVGVLVTQRWNVYGYGGFGGDEIQNCGTDGEAVFPARIVFGFFGMRVLRRVNAFGTQCMGYLIFGGFSSSFTDRWGPIVSFDLKLPPGPWLPVSWGTVPEIDQDLLTPRFSGGFNRYIYMSNVRPDRPTVYVGGDQESFFRSTCVELRLRKATEEERSAILSHPRRNAMLEMYAREGR